MSEISEKMKTYVESQIGTDVKTIIAYAIRKTNTLKDDEIVDNIDEVIDVIAESFNDIADVSPTDKEAKDAILRVLEKVASMTETKWDDRAIPILKMFL